MEADLERAFEVCRRIHKQYGTSYYFATRLFPRDIRLATHALYAFFRIPDEIVDGQGDKRRERLEAWIQHWQEAYHTGVSTEPVLVAAYWVFKHFSIPYSYSEAFFAAMLEDVEVSLYETYEDLRKYMYGSAAVVGLMMTHVIGFTQPAALKYAEALGYAMQLTNFTRDIREDWEERRRIYLPQDELRKFGITREQLQSGTVNEAWKVYMRFQIQRADELFEEANQGIYLLAPRGRLAVRAGSDLYRMILRKIEEQDYDVFSKRARTSFWEKVWCILHVSWPAVRRLR